MNDMILNLLANDSFTISDFRAVGLSAENTKLESEEKYLESKMIQENDLFKDVNGEFSKDLFHQYYLGATAFYNALADETYLEDITKNTFYSKDNLFAPEESHTIDETPQFVVAQNPFMQNSSLTRMGKRGDRTLSISEIAQSQKIYDSKTKEFTNESVNDNALENGLFKWIGDLFSEPLVIAQWEEDGEHIDLLTGEKTTHKKGDYKYNENGTFYYETLNGRNVYGKQVLNKMNTLTVDGSKINAYDFFDSDDLEQKSIGSSILKNAALVGGMFIPGIKYPLIALSVGTQAIGLIGALGKLILGSDNETSNNLHAWAKTVNRQTSTEYASQNPWCWENIINLVGDSMGQIAEQRFIFQNVPALFKGTKGIKARTKEGEQKIIEQYIKNIEKANSKKLYDNINKIRNSNSKNSIEEIAELGRQFKITSQIKATEQLSKYMNDYNKLGSVISKAYMTGIVVQDTYSEAKANGASDIEAFLLTLGYAAGELAILNTPVGEWMMPELNGDKLKYATMVKKLKEEIKPLAVNTSTKQGKQNFFKKAVNIGKDMATDDYARRQFTSATPSTIKTVLGHGLSEGVEEVTEEIWADIAKSAFNTINWLRDDDTRLTAWEDVGTRYGMSLIGGLLGGSFSSASTDFSYAKNLSKMTSESAIQEMIYMANNDKLDDFLKFVNKSVIGDKHLSFETDENGNFKPGDENNNQDKEIKKIINLQAKIIKDTITAEGGKFSENSLFDAVTLKDFRFAQLRNTSAAAAVFQEYNTIMSDIYKLKDEIKTIVGDTDKDLRRELTETDENLLKEKREKLKELRLRREGIVSGKRAPEFMQAAIYEASPVLHSHSRKLTFQGFAEDRTNKKFADITEEEIKKLKPEYQNYRSTEMKSDVIEDSRHFVDLVGLASSSIKSSEDYLKSIQKEGNEKILEIQEFLFNALNRINVQSFNEDLDPEEYVNKTQGTLVKLIAKSSEYLTNNLDIDREAFIQRLNYINNAEKSKFYTDNKKEEEKVTLQTELFSDYIDTILSEFLEQDFIHPDVQNNLIQMINSSISILEETISEEDSLLSDFPDNYTIQELSAYNSVPIGDIVPFQITRINTLKNNINHLKDVREKILDKDHTPIIKLIEDFKISTSDSDTSVGDVLNKVNDLVSQNYNNIKELQLTQEFIDQIDEVDEVIDLYASALYATRIDDNSTLNSFGYSKTLNELNKKYGNDQWKELAEIEGQTAEIILSDLSLIKEKLKFAKTISAINKGQKLNSQNNVGYNNNYIFYNKVTNLFELLRRDDKLDLDLDFNSIDEVLPEIQLLRSYNNKERKGRTFNLTDQEKIKLKKESVLLNDAIYQFFNDNDLVNNVDKLSKILNPKFLNLFNENFDLVTDQNDDLDDNSFVFKLATRAALKSSAFYGNLNNILSDKKAPVPMQLEGVYTVLAYLMNGDVMNNFAKAYDKGMVDSFENYNPEERKTALSKMGYDAETIKAIANNPDIFKNEPVAKRYLNSVLIEGIAGSGKTSGVGGFLIDILKNTHRDLLKDIYFSHSTEKNAKDFLSEHGLTGKVFSSNDEEIKENKNLDLIQHFYSNYDTDYDSHITVQNYNISHDFRLNDGLTNVPKIVFIDEISKYDGIQLRLLEDAAKHYGFIIVGFGDFDQISREVELKNQNGKEKTTFNLKLNKLNFTRVDKLGLSFRSMNSQMVNNQNEALVKLRNKTDKKFNVRYYEDDNTIKGFKVSSDFEQIKKDINKIKSQLKEKQKLTYLYSNPDSEMLKKVQDEFGDFIEKKQIDRSQGLEDDYYVIEFGEVKDSMSSAKAEFYTAITRAREGGIILSNHIDTKGSDQVQINNIKDKSTEMYYMSEKSIQIFSDNNKKEWAEVFNGSDIPKLDYKPVTIVTKSPEIEPTEEEGFPPPLPSMTSDSTKEDSEEEVEEEVEKESEEEVEEESKEEAEEESKKESEPEESKEEVEEEVEEESKEESEAPKEESEEPKEKSEEEVKEDKEEAKGEEESKEVKSEEESKEDSKEESKKKSKEKNKEVNAIILTSIMLEEEDFGEDDLNYNVQLDNSNTLSIEVPINGKTIKHRVYTFNSYETGVLWEKNKQEKDKWEKDELENYKIKPEHFDTTTVIGQATKARIDNVNGLINLKVVNEKTSKKEVMRIINSIHNILTHFNNKETILKRIEELCRINSLGSLDYGIKFSAFPGKGEDYATDPSGKNGEYAIFNKHRDEKIEYDEHNNEGKSKNNRSKSNLVAVIKDADGNKVLEITLGTINSPLTLGKMKNESGDYFFPEVAEEIDKLGNNPSGEDIYDCCNKCIGICEEKGYNQLRDLFRAFVNTSNGFMYLPRDFNLSSRMKRGPQVATTKGAFQVNGRNQYNTTYIDIDQFLKISKEATVSNIYIPKTNVYGGKILPYIQPGHVGVFITFNPEHDKENLPQLFLSQQSDDYKGNKDIILCYIMPPDATIEQYLRSLSNRYINKRDGKALPTPNIGNMFTPYRLLSNLLNGEGDIVNSSFDAKKSDIIEYIKKLQAIETADHTDDEGYKQLLEEYKKVYSESIAKKFANRNTILKKQHDLLTSKATSTDSIINQLFDSKGYKVYNVLQYYLVNSVYDLNNNTIDTKNLELLKKYNKNTIKYKVSYEGGENKSKSVFIKADVKGYTMQTIDNDGNETRSYFKINEKVDPPIYELDLDDIIHEFASWKWSEDGKRRVQSKRVNKGTYAYLNDENSKKSSNFDKFKEDNKLFFDIIKDITVSDENASFEKIAEEVLTQFNKSENHIGIGVRQNDTVKIYAYDVNKLLERYRDEPDRSEVGLKGITLNQSGIINPDGEIEVKHSGKRFVMKIIDDKLQISIYKDTPDLIKLKDSVSKPSDEVVERFKQDIFKIRSLAKAFEKPLEELINSRSLKNILERLNNIENKTEAVKAVIQYLSGSSVQLGENVVYNNKDYTITQIDGNNITLNNDVTVNLDELYKRDESTNCPTVIKI